ncbi:MAG: DUF4340 domain-containing protein [Treponema sp.]|nr:DUF4340 domain-containing protein [Treponema sp.]
MKTRKIILIAVDVILLAVCIVQGVLSSRTTVKTYKYDAQPDEIIMETSQGNYSIVKENDEWFVGEKKYLATMSIINNFLEDVSEITAIDKMGKVTNETTAQRYELVDGKKITVTLKSKGKVLRTIALGKESSTGTQCYATIDGGDDIFLISDNLRVVFDKSVEDIRSRAVIDLEKNDITSVFVTEASGRNWTISRTGTGENLTWAISGADVELDSSKATEFFNGLAALMTTKWHEENAVLGGEKDRVLEIRVGSKTVKLEIYKIIGEEKDTYYGIYSETPYPFDIAGYSVTKYQKAPEDLAK